MLTYENYMEKLPDELTGIWQRQTWVENAMIRGLSPGEAYSDQRAVFEAADELSALETEVLRLIVFQFGCSPFNMEILTERSSMRLTGAELEIGLIGLRRRGIVCTFRKMWGELLFALPWDGFRAWRECLIHNCDIPAADQVARISADLPRLSAGLAQDMFALLLLAAKEEVPLTAKGALTKRHILRFKEAVKMPCGPLADSGLQYAMCDLYDPTLAVALDMTMRLGLLTEVDSALRLQADKLSVWLALESEGQQAVLYRKWLELRLPEEAWLQHAVALIERFPPDQMFTTDAVAVSVHLSGVTTDLAVSSMAERLRTEWCAPLAALGFLEENIDESGRFIYHQRYATLTALGLRQGSIQQDEAREHGGCIYVQPDFELIVPPTAPLAVCWEAAMLGDTVQWNDDCLRITLTKERFYAVCRLGRTAETTLRFLSGHALYGVPDNVADAIRSWGASFGKARIAEATLLYCADAETADAVAASKRCAPFILSRIAPESFVVRSDSVAALTKELGKIGIVPASSLDDASGGGAGLPEIAMPETDLWADAEKYFGTENPNRRGLILARNTGIHYQPDARLPSYEDAYAGFSDVPSLWFSELRTYHASTRKEIVRKAIEWRSFVKLRKDGAERTVVPRTLSEFGDRWSILGFERGSAEAEPINEVCVESDEWEEMQLMLPGKEVITYGTI